MSNNIRPISSGKNLVTGGGTEGTDVNHWRQVVAIAKPTLDAARQLREARDWLADRQQYRRVLIDLDSVDDADEEDARSRLAIIPEVVVLQEAAQLFDDAIRKAAPEAWYHLAIGTMLASMPNAKNVAGDYTFVMVDVLMYDDESRERGCQPGFSAPVFVSAIRRVLSEQTFVPTAAELLKACREYRHRFKALSVDVEALIQVRKNAEEALKAWDFEWTEEDELRRRKDYVPREYDVPF